MYSENTLPATPSAPPSATTPAIVRTGAPRGRRKLSAEARAAAATRRQMEGELSTAVKHDGFVLHYQPRVDLGSGRIVSAEALIRWPTRKRGLVAPAGFIPVAEASDLINDIGGWVLRTACQAAVNWASTPHHGAPALSVNVSARQLQGDVLLNQVAEALEHSGLVPERLELELTESLLVDVDIETLLMLSAIRDLGVSLALDDFGTGYASLSVLKRLPLTVMKLDRSLVRELPGGEDDATIARAVIDIGHALGLIVVAEGIETEQQRAMLSCMRCDHGQGFLFSHPMPAAQLDDKLNGAPAAFCAYG